MLLGDVADFGVALQARQADRQVPLDLRHGPVARTVDAPLHGERLLLLRQCLLVSTEEHQGQALGREVRRGQRAVPRHMAPMEGQRPPPHRKRLFGATEGREGERGVVEHLPEGGIALALRSCVTVQHLLEELEGLHRTPDAVVHGGEIAPRDGELLVVGVEQLLGDPDARLDDG